MENEQGGENQDKARKWKREQKESEKPTEMRDRVEREETRFHSFPRRPLLSFFSSPSCVFFYCFLLLDFRFSFAQGAMMRW